MKAKYESSDEDMKDMIKSAISALDEGLAAAFVEGEEEFECEITEFTTESKV